MNIIEKLLIRMKIARSLKINMVDTDKLIYLMKKEVQAK